MTRTVVPAEIVALRVALVVALVRRFTAAGRIGQLRCRRRRRRGRRLRQDRRAADREQARVVDARAVRCLRRAAAEPVIRRRKLDRAMGRRAHEVALRRRHGLRDRDRAALAVGPVAVAADLVGGVGGARAVPVDDLAARPRVAVEHREDLAGAIGGPVALPAALDVVREVRPDRHVPGASRDREGGLRRAGERRIPRDRDEARVDRQARLAECLAVGAHEPHERGSLRVRSGRRRRRRDRGRLEQLGGGVDVADAVERRDGLAVDGVDLEPLRARNGRPARGAVRTAVHGRDGTDRRPSRDQGLARGACLRAGAQADAVARGDHRRGGVGGRGNGEASEEQQGQQRGNGQHRAPGLGSRVGDHDVPLRGGAVCPS